MKSIEPSRKEHVAEKNLDDRQLSRCYAGPYAHNLSPLVPLVCLSFTGPAARLAADLKANPPSSHVVTSFVGNESPSWSMSCITIALTRLLIASWLPATSLVLAHHLIRTVPGQVRSYNFRWLLRWFRLLHHFVKSVPIGNRPQHILVTRNDILAWTISRLDSVGLHWQRLCSHRTHSSAILFS